MITLEELTHYCDELLEVNNFEDYCPNGLQVQGKPVVNKIVSGVTASLAFLQAAIAAKADVILVHHGYFWRGEEARIVDMKRNRLYTLLINNVSMLAYHLPLDAHPIYGNNAQLAKVLGIEVTGRFDTNTNPSIGFLGELKTPQTGEAFAQHIEACLSRKPLHIRGGEQDIQHIAWCTGGAQGYIEAAAKAGAEAYITGEASERTNHEALEHGIHFYAAGHHATERYGVQALARHLAEKFDLEHAFIDINNPI